MGTINKSGELKISRQLLNQIAQHPNSRVLITLDIQDSNKSRQAMIGYYFKIVLPEYRKAILRHYSERKTKIQTDIFMRRESPICHDEIYNVESQKLELIRLKEIRELSYQELQDHIDHCLEMAVVNYGVVIPSPIKK